MSDKFLGIDIGGTSAKFGIVTDEGKLEATDSYAVSFDDYKTPILETVLQSTDIFMKKNDLPFSSVKAVAVSATGQIDSEKGIVSGTCGNIANWENVKIKEAFEKKYNLKTCVVNDANCVALGEKWIGGAKNCKHAIILTIGTGVGGGIIVDGKILLGERGYGGELGHFGIDKNGRKCTCGNTGCLEQYASTTALIRSVREYFEQNDSSFLENHVINGITVFEMAKRNKDIVNILDGWIADTAYGITSLVHIFNPEIVLLGGGISNEKEMFIDKVREKVLCSVMKNFGKNLKIQGASLKNNAGLIGAVYYAKQQL